MITQVLLSGLLLAAFVYAFTQYRAAPAIGAAGLLISAVGLYFVWLPEHANVLAHFMGVGRGADFILNLWAAFTLVELLNLHLKIRKQSEAITALCRAVAISSATIPDTP
jgi:hypothetical protein